MSLGDRVSAEQLNMLAVMARRPKGMLMVRHPEDVRILMTLVHTDYVSDVYEHFAGSFSGMITEAGRALLHSQDQKGERA